MVFETCIVYILVLLTCQRMKSYQEVCQRLGPLSTYRCQARRLEVVILVSLRGSEKPELERRPGKARPYIEDLVRICMQKRPP